MNAVILISSETGYTRTYADWISEETGFKVHEMNPHAKLIPSNYQLILFGSPIYGGELLGQKQLNKLLREAKGAKIICFATGLYPWSETAEENLRKKILRDDHPDISFYYLPGGLDKENLKPARKTELFLYRMMMNRHPQSGEAQRVFLERTDRSGDYTDRDLLKPLLGEITKYEEMRTKK